MDIRPLLVLFLLLTASASLLSQAVEKSDSTVQAGNVAGRGGGLYLGAYVFPLFRRDWGVVTAIQTRKLYIEASWQKANRNRDYLLDQQLKGVEDAGKEKVYWDGYYAHLAINGIFRKSGKHGNRSYMGALLGYNLREFETIISNVSDENNAFLGTYGFNPTDTRYILMLNMGQHLNGRIMAADFYMSLGGAYDEFRRGNQQFDTGNYSFERIVLKRKDSRFGFIFRVGVTVGLQFGPQTFRR